ncbi:MAG: saccharopine dehydrogenase NADP-binding domain-containing protein [Alphaproteobacteria bacterium]|nr:saccharopine dehydrogenase NADP-binding domain-containing protein [Alphaproteobacteria bacterium]
MRVVVLGAGKIGAAIARMLVEAGDWRVAVADGDPATLADLPPAARRIEARVDDPATLAQILSGHDAVISACPYFVNHTVARVAREVGVHYLDLTEDVETTRQIRSLSEGARTAFVPQCGLAPGFVGIVAHDLFGRFESVQSMRLRVGALPQFPANGLKYNLTWSTDGLINEYLNACEVIHEGRRREALPLEAVEHFALDGIDYEAFNTSGGLGTLCDTLDGRIEFLDYKTVRYPGHCQAMRLLVHDLALWRRRDLLKQILEEAIPVTLQDVVLIFVTASGMRDGRLTQETWARKIYGAEIGGRRWSAIQTTTAAAACAMLDLLRAGRLPREGFVRQEDASLTDLLNNRFGRYYA